jgi:hypothetical protein
LSIEKYADDSYQAASRLLLPQAEEIFRLIKDYRARQADSLPAEAITCIDNFVETSGRLSRTGPRLSA